MNMGTFCGWLTLIAVGIVVSMWVYQLLIDTPRAHRRWRAQGIPIPPSERWTARWPDKVRCLAIMIGLGVYGYLLATGVIY